MGKRPLARDFSERAAYIFRYSVVPYLDKAALVLHATDPVFDYDPWSMPRQHRYVGPLLWELPGSVPDYLGETGEPWVLCTLSSLAQDDRAARKWGDSAAVDSGKARQESRRSTAKHERHIFYDGELLRASSGLEYD